MTVTEIVDRLSRAHVTIAQGAWPLDAPWPTLNVGAPAPLSPTAAAFVRNYKPAILYTLWLPQFESTSNILFRMEVGRRGSRYPMLFALFISLKCALELCEDAMTNLGVTP